MKLLTHSAHTYPVVLCQVQLWRGGGARPLKVDSRWTTRKLSGGEGPRQGPTFTRELEGCLRAGSQDTRCQGAQKEHRPWGGPVLPLGCQWGWG